MRSRYTAFVLRDADHLWRTWHPRTRPASVGDLDGINWRGLAIDATEGGWAPEETTGTVTFAAAYETSAGQRGVLREHSLFERRAGRWFYVDGDDLG